MQSLSHSFRICLPWQRSRSNDSDAEKKPPLVDLGLKSSKSGIQLMPSDSKAIVEERAAILEFERGLDRQSAEKQAMLEWAVQARRRRLGPRRIKVSSEGRETR